MKQKLLNKLKNAIKENQSAIKKANEIDKKHYNMIFDIKKLIEISDELKESELNENIKKDIFVIHNGNPYITYILAVKAICNNKNIKICINETMLGVNSIIIKIINEVLKEMKIKIRD